MISTPRRSRIASAPGRSRRSRANQQRMQVEYDQHIGYREPINYESTVARRSAKAALLLLACMPIVGCIGAAPMSLLIVVGTLFGVLGLGELVDADPTQRYWVMFRKQPLWKVGESKEEVFERRLLPSLTSVVDEERYPEDYAGRVQCVIPAEQSRPPWASDAFDCICIDMTVTRYQECWQRAVKVVDGRLTPVTFEDKFGAIVPELRKKYTDAQVLAAKHEVDDLSQEILADIQLFRSALPQTITHTGTGLYSVKGTPVNESETQSGAVAGQVVTIVGTVAASPAFTGGYISNTTQAEVRAIVSHDTTTATMEGDISGWGDGDTLEFYDSWSTVDAAGEQLLVDQGVTDYSSEQEIRIYAGTYVEAINIGDMEPTPQFRLMFKPNGTDSVTLSNTGQAAALIEMNNTENIEIYDMTLNCDNNYMIDANGRGPWYLYDVVCQGGNGGIVGGAVCTRCTFTSLNYAFRSSKLTFVRCTFTSCTDGAFWGFVVEWLRLYSCVFDGCTDCVSYNTFQSTVFITPQIEVINCTVYNSTNFLHMTSATDSNPLMISIKNTIFHTVTTTYYADNAASESYYLDCDYNTYYTVTQVAYLGGSNLSFATWQSETDREGRSPDANSVETDPDIADPGADDWSLDADSDCTHAGIGSYAVVPIGVNEVDFDKWHPDKGAWSSGPGPNVVS